MGLDMSLERMPRYKKVTADKISKVERYIDYIEDCKDPNSSAKNYSMKEWCGVTENDVSPELLEFYKPFHTLKYGEWDIEKRHGHSRIIEEVAYWRKANHIHNWFVNAVQDGIDDCCYHNEVTKEVLEELLATCEEVLKRSVLIPGPVINGYTYKDGAKIPNLEEGKYIADVSVAQALLPTTSGFFFGGTEYDEYYYDQVKYTAETVKKILETTDFDKEMVYYISSW